MTILVVVAVAAERDSVVRDLGSVQHLDLPPYGERFCGDQPCCVRVTTPAGDIHVVPGGVGPAASAAATATALATNTYDCVVSAGIAGGFVGRAAVGDVVVATDSIAADLGCRTDDGFMSLKDMGLGQDSGVGFGHAWKWADRIESGGVRVATGEILTVSCMTGTDEDNLQLARRHPRAVAESMEGWGVTWPSYLRRNQNCGEIRAISNLVGRRDPSAWDLTGALDALSRAFAVLLAEPLP